MISLVAALTAFATPAALPNIPEKGPCKDSLDVAIFTSPQYAHKKTRLTVMIVSDKDLGDVEVAALTPQKELIKLEARHLGGPPHGWVAHVDKPMKGRWRIAIGNGDTLAACQKVTVRNAGGRRAKILEGEDPIWTPRWKWERDTENLFSLWVEHLFEAPLADEPTWRPLHEVLWNAERNLLFNRLNLGEDGPRKETRLKFKPDCADFPYALRAYFAWKMSLPFTFRGCNRGTTKRAPSCRAEPQSHQSLAQSELVSRAFEKFVRKEVNRVVHSSTPRTLPEDERSDFYPVKMTRRGVRPGAIFADPYGHILVVQKWVPQTATTPGILFAVDAQPDKTVGRRRFWRGSFLFPEDGSVSGAGFKRFRPARVRRKDQELYVLSNESIAGSVDYGDFSTEQWTGGKEAFYESMDALINPEPMAPKTAFSAALDALTEQTRRRVKSVDAGEGWKKSHVGKVMEMPKGSSIFQTAGAWEDYSTPSRDLRLLIAIQTVVDYPKRVVKYPKRFILPEGISAADAEKKLTEELMAEARTRTFTYTRTDGSTTELTIADIIERRTALEAAYNPNDCPEIRWGAAPDSDEYKTCKDHAPEDQQEKMAEYRVWFKERRRPVR